ncbi:MAG: glycosyltransferase family 39 protein [Chloroflexi bacterium]|nr:glycosyltransferase family 39 protein [Chloroflexota bacterium]
MLVLVTLVAFALRLHRLADGNVWWDEGYSISLARQDLVSLALATAGDVHPPVHYWFLHGWIRLVGETELVVRFSSVWFALLAIPLIYRLGRRIFGREVGLTAAALLATSRFHVEWSQQIRMYTLVMVLAMLSIALTLRLWERPRRRDWAASVAVTTAGLYTLYLSGLVPLVESLATGLLWLLPVGGRRLSAGFLARWTGAQLLSLALFAPWVALFLNTPHATPKLLYPIDLRGFLHASATAFPLGISAYVERYTPVTLAHLAILALAVAVVARRPLQRVGVLLYALLLIPPVVVYALSFPNPVLYAPNLSVRYLLIFLPAYHLLVAAGFHKLRRAPGILIAAFLAGAAVWSLMDYYSGRRLVDDYQTVVRYLAAHGRTGDAVILNSDRDWPIYLYYAGGTLPWYGVGSLEPIAPAGAAELLAPLLARHGSLWLLTSDSAADSDPAGHVPAWLGAHSRLVGTITAGRRALALYSTDPARSVGGPVTLRPSRPVDVAFDGGLIVLGYDLPVAEIAPDEILRLAVYWQVAGPLPADARAALRLLDERGVVYRDVPVPLSFTLPPDRWPAGQTVRADYALPIPRAMPPGSYTLVLAAVFGDRDLPAVGSSGAGGARLRSIRVVGPGVSQPTVPLQYPTDDSLGDRIRLLGYDLATAPGGELQSGVPVRGALAPGTALRLRLAWQALRAMDRPYTVFLQLVGSQINPATGNPVWAQRDAFPQAGRHPTSEWVPGEVVLDDYELTVPANAPPGEYVVQVGFYELATGRRLPVVQDGQAKGDSIVLLLATLRSH